MEEYFKIKGGGELHGRYEVRGAKNAVLPLIAMGIMSDEDVIIENCPLISDVESMLELIGELGAEYTREGRRIVVHTRARRTRVCERLSKSMRSSMFMLGVLLSTLKEVELPLPGGCRIGARPLDIHLEGLRKMGAKIEWQGDWLRCSAKRLHGDKIIMKYPSVGATENLMLCATLAEGKTTLVNCAREPEICSLAEGLRAMGAHISGEGTSVVEIDGVESLGGGRVYPVGDRIVGGTLMCGVALCGGEVTLEGVNKNHLGALIDILSSSGCAIDGDDAGIRIRSMGRTGAFNATTAPYPLFPTDLQAPLLSLACFSDGVCSIKETVFENRFANVAELKRLGARITLVDNTALIEGCRNSQKPYPIVSGDMRASDLRGGAALVLAALKLRGESRVFGVRYVDRGYEELENILCSLGAYVIRKRG